MRYLIALVFIVLMNCEALHAQDFTDFGLPTLAEFQMQKCDFEPDAEAVMLVHEARSDYDDQYRLITAHHYRLKILKEKGISYATITIDYYADDEIESIIDLEAVVINKEPNGEIRRESVDRKSFYVQKTDKNSREIRFTFPSVKVGSILEYKYRSIRRSYSYLEDWAFQDVIPVVTSRYYLSMVPTREFSYVVQQTPPYEATVKATEREGNVRFEMKNIKSLPFEAYMDARRDYLQRVDFQMSKYTGNGGVRKFMTNWSEVIRELMSSQIFGTQLNKNLSGTDEFIQRAKSITNEENRMREVYDFVRKNMTWNYVATLGSSDGVKAAWDKKSGTTGDINLILVNLLQATGLDASPLLVSERRFGRVNPNVPFYDQFNKTMSIVSVGEKSFILDATNKHLRYTMMPPSILNTIALVVKKKGTLINIADLSTSYKRLASVSAKLGADGLVSGDSYLSFSDYARSERLESYQEDANNYIDGYKQYIPNTIIENFEHQNDENDSLPFINKFKFSAPANVSGEYTFVNLNFFTGFQSNPFIAETRISNINFGWKTNYSNTIMLELDDSFQADELPKSLQITNNDKSLIFSRDVIKDESGKKFLIRIKFTNNTSFFAAENYSDIQQFYKKIFELLNEPIVVKKI